MTLIEKDASLSCTVATLPGPGETSLLPQFSEGLSDAGNITRSYGYRLHKPPRPAGRNRKERTSASGVLPQYSVRYPGTPGY